MVSPDMTDRLYRIFDAIEERGLQFVMPAEWKPLYRIYLFEKRINKLIAIIQESIKKLDSNK